MSIESMSPSSNRAEHKDAPHLTDSVPNTPFAAYDNQGGAIQYKPTATSDGYQNNVMNQFPAPDCVFQQSIGIGGTAERTPAVMAAVTAATAESERLFPQTSADHPVMTWRGAAPDWNDDDNFGSVGNAAYRYIMNKEGLDDYSATSSSDIATINQWNPGAIKTMDAFVADQEAQGLVPLGVPKDCANQ
jgi:hypothetical protein